MSTWKYCEIENPDHSPKLVFYESQHARTRDLVENVDALNHDYNKIRQAVSQCVSALGSKGWEMVGCGNIAERAHVIYFKKKICKAM